MIKADYVNSSKELVPAGSHLARCYEMIELGTVEDTYEGRTKNVRKVRISWELPLEQRVFKESEGEQPFVVSKEFNLYMNEKATLRGFVESWRGKAYSEEEAKDFEVTKLVGAPCMITIIHDKTKKGTDYAKVASVSPVVKGMQIPPQINPSRIVYYGMPDFFEVFKQLPEFIQEKMKASLEFHNLAEKSINSEPQKSDDLPF